MTFLKKISRKNILDEKIFLFKLMKNKMKHFQKTLPNKLRLQGIQIPGTNVATILVLVGAGSRYENENIKGLSHFLEHMFFKGAKKYKTPKEVSTAVDSFGGEFNAFTGKEYCGYYIKSNKQNLELSTDVLSDMLLAPQFNTKEIEKERGVILEEMAMYLDAPMYQISWNFERLAFGDQPLGWDQIGTKESILSLQQKDFFEYKKSLYVPENTVITIAGAVEEKDLDLLEKYFQFENEKQTRTEKKFDTTKATEKLKIHTKKTEQYHISFGVRTMAERDDRFPALKILGVILGGNMSSRMFQNIREEKGLCYSIRTSVDEYTDTGLLRTNAGVKLSDVLRATEAIRYEYDQVREKGVTAKEMEKAKNYICGKTDLLTEDTEDIAHHYSKEVLLYQDIESFEEWKEKVKKTTQSEVNELAKELFQPENFRFCGIGPEIDEEALLKIIS